MTSCFTTVKECKFDLHINIEVAGEIVWFVEQTFFPHIHATKSLTSCSCVTSYFNLD